MFPILLISPSQVFAKLTSVKWKQASGWGVFKLYQNTKRLVTVSRLKSALNTVDHMI